MCAHICPDNWLLIASFLEDPTSVLISKDIIIYYINNADKIAYIPCIIDIIHELDRESIINLVTNTTDARNVAFLPLVYYYDSEVIDRLACNRHMDETEMLGVAMSVFANLSKKRRNRVINILIERARPRESPDYWRSIGYLLSYIGNLGWADCLTRCCISGAAARKIYTEFTFTQLLSMMNQCCYFGFMMTHYFDIDMAVFFMNIMLIESPLSYEAMGPYKEDTKSCVLSISKCFQKIMYSGPFK